MKRLLLITIIIIAFCLLPKMAKAGIIVRPVFHTGLVGYWDFQEGAGDKAYDKSGYDNDGTLTNMAESDWVDGKIGKALDFTGTSQHVEVTHSEDLNLTRPMTMSVWIYPTTNTGPWNRFVDKNYNTSYYLGSGDGTNDLAFWVEGTQVVDTANSLLALGVWQHVVVTYNNDGDAIIYLNGNNVGNGSYTGVITNNTTNLHIGIGYDHSANYDFEGSIDEVRIYNRALSAGEVQRLYKLSQPKILAPTKTGLVGYWSFEEGTGTKVGDFSGNNNAGTFQAGLAQNDWIDGKIGKALNFDGAANDYIDYGNPVSLQLGNTGTVATWLKFSALPHNAGIVSKNDWVNDRNGYNLGAATNNVVYGEIANDSTYNQIQTTRALNDNAWHCVVFTWDGSYLRIYVDGVSDSAPVEQNISAISNVYNLHIGKIAAVDNYYYHGKIDEVRIYSRALETSEITALYNSGLAKINASQNNQLTNGLVGLWSFNGPDMDGDTAIDRSGQGNNGVITGTTRAIGKVGQAISFNGTSNYVDAGDIDALDGASTLTISMWYKRRTTDSGIPLEKGPDTNTKVGINITNQSGGIIYFNVSNGGNVWGQITSGDTNWHLVTMVFDGNQSGNTGKLKGYLDGVQQSLSYTGIIPSTTGTNASHVIIGKSDIYSQVGDGLIDELRIYNRALTSQEVQRLYNLGQ